MQDSGRGPALLAPARRPGVEGAGTGYEADASYTAYEVQRATTLEPHSPRHDNSGHCGNRGSPKVGCG